MRAPLLGAMLGDAPSFKTLAERTTALVNSIPIPAAPAASGLAPLMARVQRNADMLSARQETVLQAHQALRAINKGAPARLQETESLHSEELVAGAQPVRLAAVGQLLMLTQRIAKSAVEMISIDRVDPEAVFLLGKDTQSFQIIASALRDGSSELRIRPAKTARTKELLGQVLEGIAQTKGLADRVLSNLRELVTAREAQAQLLVDAETLEKWLEPQCFGPGR